MALFEQKGSNPNYLARIDRITEIHPIPDAHSIVKAVIGTDTVVVGSDMKVGDVVVFFPVGAAICEQYLGANNLYEAAHHLHNANHIIYESAAMRLTATEDEHEANLLRSQMKQMVGFFNYHGTVRPLKLRGQISMGFVAPTITLEKAFSALHYLDWSQYVGTEFDMVDGMEVCWKYIPPVKTPQRLPKPHPKTEPTKAFNRIIPDTLKQHYDTKHLERSAKDIYPDDVITETVKLHGTSAIYANIPVRRQLTWFEKVKRFFGLKVESIDYGDVFSSRRVILNRYEGRDPKDDEYNTIYKVIKDFIGHDMTVYGEIVGYTKTGKCIQSPRGIDHDYGCEKGKCAFMPYRISSLMANGRVCEWSVSAVKEWTDSVIKSLKGTPNEGAIKSITILYHGRAGEQYGLYKSIQERYTYDDYQNAYKEWAENSSTEELAPPKYLESHAEFLRHHWRIEWIERMRNDKELLGMELPEPLCKNKKAPREGIVIRIDGDMTPRAWKLKTKAHAMLAQKALDAGEVDQEDIN
jgi:hypothetical protein